MKDRAIYLIFFLIIASCFTIKAANNGELAGFTLAAENQDLRFYLDQETTEFAVYRKDTRQIWYSNPRNLEQTERIAYGSARDKLRSQLSITYFITGDKRLTMDNYNQSIKYQQFEIKPLKNGVRIDYLLGKKWLEEDYLPIMVSQERFEQLILARLVHPADREFIKKRYELISLEKRPEPVENKDAQRLFGDYRLYSHSNREEEVAATFLDYSPNKLNQVELIEMLVTQLVEYNNKFQLNLDVTGEHVAQLRGNPTYILRNDVPKWDLPEIIRIVQESGYQPEDIQHDHRINNLDQPRPNNMVFAIPVEYRLDGPDLLVNIPVDEISYPQDIINEQGNKTDFPLHAIELLEYFGAADSEQAGYIFVPDGPGALIRLNNGKINALPYIQPLYGLNYTTMPQKEKLNNLQQNYLPVFALKEGSQAWLAIIEEGDALASIKADIAGRNNSYNSVWTKFTTIPKGTVTLQMETENENEQGRERLINIYQSRIYQGNIRLRYRFLSGTAANYTGMALSYQEYLQQKGLSRLTPADDIPFYLELIGAFDQKEVVLGAPRQVVKPLTTYRQAEEILQELIDGGVSNIKLKYNGMLAGGLAQQFPSRFRPEKVLGQQRDFQRLTSFLSAHQISFYPEVCFLNVYRDSLFDHFRAGSDAARFLDYGVARIYDYNLATYQYQPDEHVTILSPHRLDSLLSQFLSDLTRDQLTGISLREMGRQLNSDFRKDPTALVDRQQSLVLIQRQLEKLKQHKFSIMVNGGNGFLLPLVDHIVNMPFTGNNFNIIDQEVPFFQISLHGYVNYATPPLNLGEESRRGLLKALETGASPYYKWTYQPSSLLKGTSYAHDLLASYYRDWLSEAGELYREVNQVLHGLQDKRIIGHRQLAENVYLTSYENSCSIVVNYNQQAVTVNGITVAAEGYQVLEEGSLR